ncbi:MAG: hypothetical protein V3V88_01070 [Dehalococcoidia bacterium]
MVKTTMLSFKVENLGVIVTEHLRYMGVVGVTGMGHTGHVSYEVEREIGILNNDETIIIVECPKGLVPSVWADQNIRRLRSFGIKAVVWKS